VQQILDSDSGRAIISQGDDWSNDELDTDLLGLECVGSLVGVVSGVHDCRSELGACLWEEDLESQAGSVHFDG